MQVDVLTLAISTCVTGAVGWGIKLLLDTMKGYIAESAAWRKATDDTIHTILSAQCTQMRADITHKMHRYLDDLGCASQEEKDSLMAEYKEYCAICKKYGIINHFIDAMMQRVMDLPTREI